MADTEREFRRCSKAAVQGTATGEFTGTSYGNVANLRTRLNAINSGFYTTAMMNSMTKNDMVMAVRLVDDPGTI